jgi:hypothetical protein
MISVFCGLSEDNVHDPRATDIIRRLSAAVIDVETIAADADDMFWAPLRAPKGAIPEAKLVFARAVGHVICLAAETMAMESGLDIAAQRALRLAFQQQLTLDTFVHLPGFSGEEDSRSAVAYLTVPSGRGDALQELVSLYAGQLEALFKGKAGPNVRRSAKLAVEAAMRPTLDSMQRPAGM